MRGDVEVCLDDGGRPLTCRARPFFFFSRWHPPAAVASATGLCRVHGDTVGAVI